MHCYKYNLTSGYLRLNRPRFATRSMRLVRSTPHETPADLAPTSYIGPAAGPQTQLVAGARNSRFLRLVESGVPQLAA